ncbi:MAG TPA: AI-2E family transporter [Candidatus Acidoferrum sp.]|nr:AI-2E family transporter [Candidatus Acidoferrum sp.]
MIGLPKRSLPPEVESPGEAARDPGAARREAQPGILSWLIVIAVTCILLWLFRAVLWLVIPVLLALVVYYCLQPLAQALIRRGLTHRAAAKVVAGVVFVATALLLYILLSMAAAHGASWKAVVAHYVQGGLDFLGNSERWLTIKLPSLSKSPLLHPPPASLEAFGEGFAEKYLAVVLLQMVHWLPSLLLVPYLTYFLLRDGNVLKKRLIRSVPNAYFEKTLLLVSRVDRSLQSFFVGLMKLTFLDTATLALGLWLLGVSYPLVLGLTAAVLAWVPYIGSAAGCVLVVLVSATDFPNEPVTTYGCILLFLCVRLLDDFVFMPLTIGRSLRIHPVLSVIMLFLGAAVAGPVGLLLVLPVMGVVAVITDMLCQILGDHHLHARFRHANRLRAALANPR